MLVAALVLQTFLCPRQVPAQYLDLVYVSLSAAKNSSHLDVVPFAHLCLDLLQF